MSVAHLLTVLENDEFIERIQKRPEAFIGTTGLVGLENLLVQTINGLLSFSLKESRENCYSYRVNKSLFRYLPHDRLF